MAALGGSFIHNLLQPGVERAARVLGGLVIAQVLFVSGVAAVLGRDLV